MTLSMMSVDETISTDAMVAAVLSEGPVPPLMLTRSLALLKTVSTSNGLLWIGLREGLLNFERATPFRTSPGAPWADAYVK